MSIILILCNFASWAFLGAHSATLLVKSKKISYDYCYES